MIETARRRLHTRELCLAISSVMGVVLVWTRLANLGTGFWSDEAYSAFFRVTPPARVTIGVAALPNGAHVEIDAVVAVR